VNHGLSLYLTITVLVGIHSLANSRNVLVNFLQCQKSVAGSFKRVVWLYDKVDKQIFIVKLEIVDWIILLCQFDDVDDICVINSPKHFSNWQGSVFQPRQLLLDIMTKIKNQVSDYRLLGASNLYLQISEFL
jgi:hypothetical protein